MSFIIRNSDPTAYTTTTGSPNVTIPAATQAGINMGTGFTTGKVLVSDSNAALLFSEVSNKNYLEIKKIIDEASYINIPYVANPTLPAQNLIDGFFDLSGQTTAQTVTFDTAANVWAALQARVSGNEFTNATGLTPTTFEVKIFNNHTASGAITLAAGTGNTITGAGTIAIGTGVIVRATVTNQTTPAITYAVAVN
jgi:hypothetical protein